MKNQNIIGLLLIVFGLALLWFFADYGFGNFAAYAGQSLGQSIVITLILLVLLALTPLRKKVAILLVVGVVWFGSSALMALELYEKGASERNTAQSTIELLDSISSGEKITQKHEKKVTDTITVEEWMRNYVSRVQQVQLEYANEIESVGLGGMLTPENLINTERATQAKSKLSELKQSISGYETRVLNEMKLAEETLSKRTDPDSQAAYQGFMRKKDVGIANTKKYYELERNIIDNIEKIIDLSIGLAGKIHIQSGRIMFEDQKSLDLYNKYLNEISALSAEEEKLLNEQQQRIEESKRKMKEAL